MALNKTTLSAAVGAGDTSILIAALTGLAAGSLVLIDSEMMKVVSVPSAATLPVPVLRGQDGTKQVAHATGANVVHSSTPAIDFGGPAAGAPSIVSRPAARTRLVESISASGAISNPTPGTDKVCILNGATVIAATLSNPAKDNDGDILIVVGNGKAAHTVTYTPGVSDGGATLDVGTFAAGGQLALMFIAIDEIWVLLPAVYGGAGLANATVTFA